MHSNEGILLGSVITNYSLSADELLELIDFNEEEFCSKYGFDEIDYNEIIITPF